MTRFDEEARNAHELRTSLLVEAALTMVSQAGNPAWARDSLAGRGHPGSEIQSFIRVRDSLRLAEHITAALLTRSGASWDVLATAADAGGAAAVSRQALHKRLASGAQAAWEYAQERYGAYDLPYNRESLSSLVPTLTPEREELNLGFYFEAREARPWWL